MIKRLAPLALVAAGVPALLACEPAVTVDHIDVQCTSEEHDYEVFVWLTGDSDAHLEAIDTASGLILAADEFDNTDVEILQFTPTRMTEHSEDLTVKVEGMGTYEVVVPVPCGGKTP